MISLTAIDYISKGLKNLIEMIKDEPIGKKYATRFEVNGQYYEIVVSKVELEKKEDSK